MQFRKFILVSLFGLFAIGSNLAAADLWHFLDKETGNTLGYVKSNEGEVVFYGPTWKKFPPIRRADEPEFQFSYFSSGNLKIRIDFEFVDGRPDGHWVLIHTQARSRKELDTQRIEVDDNWGPWDALDSEDEKVLDIFGRLRARAAGLSSEDFADYWIESVEPELYAVFTLLLYREKGFQYTPEERKAKAVEVYESLKATPDIDAAEIYRQVYSDLEREYPWFELSKGVLFFPSLDNPAVTQLALAQRSPKLVLNTSSIFTDFDPARFRYYLAQSLMYEYFQNNSSLAGAGGIEDYILMSVSLYLIAELDYGSPADYLFLKDKEALAGIESRYHEIRKSFLKDTGGGRNWRRGDNAKLAEYYYLGYQFGGLLLEYYEPEDLRSYRRMEPIRRSFRNFLKYDDSKVKQLALK